MKNYGVDNPSKDKKVKDKRLNTFMKNYGVSNPNKTEKVKNKVKKTCLDKYGGNPAKTEKVKNKAKQTCIDKYGVEYYSQTDEYKNKYKQTCFDKYGVEYSLQSKFVRDKGKQTCFDKYGVSSYSKTDEYKNRMKLQSNEIRQKVYLTKKKNNSFHISKPEEVVFKFLKEKFSNVTRQYKDSRYPFICDFYVSEKDLFIEYQGTWSHGKKPFENTKEDLEKLNKWKSKNTKFYNNAIETWTVRDVLKRNIAKQNNLNYLELFIIEDVKHL
jgi:hypothetical protein